MLETDNVVKVFNAGKSSEFAAVNGVSVVVPAEQVTVLKGPSGSGKTTLLAMLGCMSRPTSGRIRLHGFAFPWLAEGEETVELAALPERFTTDVRRKVFGFVFQQFNLVRGISVLENVTLPAYPLGGDWKRVRSRGIDLLNSFGLGRHAAKKVDWLSGGEMQRVAIARALINDPAVIVADEPTAHLDTKLSREFMEMVGVMKDTGKTLLIASHDPIVCDSPLVDRVIGMRDGRVTGIETP